MLEVEADEAVDVELFANLPADEAGELYSDPLPVDDGSGYGTTVFGMAEDARLADPDDAEDAVFGASPSFDELIVDTAEPEELPAAAALAAEEPLLFAEEPSVSVGPLPASEAPADEEVAHEPAAAAQADAALDTQPLDAAEEISPSPSTAELTPSPLQNRRAALAARLGGIRPPQPRSTHPPGAS